MTNPHSIRCRTRELLVSLSIAAALGFLCAPFARAQQPELKDLAVKIAQSLQASRQKKVVVLDFTGPDQEVSALGSKLADDFSLALSQADSSLRVEDRSKMRERIESEDYSPEILLDSWGALAFARSFKVDAAVLGTISAEEDHLKVLITATRLKDDKAIGSGDATIHLTDQMAKLMRSYFEDPGFNFPQSGKNGYSFPSCRVCPIAEPSAAALRAAFPGGTVILMVVVAPDGRAHHLRVLKGLPYGLTDSAIEAVKQSKFSPATGPDHKPAAVRQIIEETYYLP
ncbi:MAG TPA: energy transducer TonB [Candidatus Acidoferrum sp.]|nr:energy transducer TonB [Candidatus Acidoferrum sp.]